MEVADDESGRVFERERMKKTHIITMIMAAAVFCVIFYFSSQSVTTSRAESSHISERLLSVFTDYDSLNAADKYDKLIEFDGVLRSCAHFGLFMMLGLSLTLSLRFTSMKRPVIAALATCAAYAVFDELHQYFFATGRACQLQDVAVDCLGSLLGAGIAILLSRVIERRLKR